VNLSNLPENVRLKLTEESEKGFWNQIEEEGGIKSFCRESEFSSSKMYNWKNKDSFLPAELVIELLGERSINIEAVKGKGRSSTIENPEFDFPEINELLTRIQTSVSVNSNGTPMYQTDDIGNAERFAELLQKLGEYPFRFYSRSSYYQINYPKFLQNVLAEKDFEPELGALVDEEGDIEDDYFVLGEEKFRIDSFEETLYSREKSMRKALEIGNRKKIEKIISSEAEKADRFIDNI
jgi:hypothetical protein